MHPQDASSSMDFSDAMSEEASSSDKEELDKHIAAVEKHLDSIRSLVSSTPDIARSTSFDAALEKINTLSRFCSNGEGEERGLQSRNKIQSVMAPPQPIMNPLALRARNEHWGIDRKEVRMGRILGEGEQGVVFKAEWRGMPVVCKKLKGHDGNKDSEFINEIEVLSRLRHPNLVLFLGACLEWEPMFILTEYLPGGSLEEFFLKKREEQSEQDRSENGLWKPPMREVLGWALDLARALCCLHKQSPPVIHRDLKPSNLLLTEEKHLKLSDFGLSKVMDSRNDATNYQMTGETGTLRYMAPEVMRHESYDEKVDIFSFGFVVWYMCTGELPLNGHVQEEFFQAAANRKNLRPNLNAISSEPLRDLLRQCWHADPSRRPSAEELVVELNYMSSF